MGDAMTAMLRYALLALSWTVAASYAPAGPDNLSTAEAAAVQERLDQFFSLFDDTKTCEAWVAAAFTPHYVALPVFNHPPPIGQVKGEAAIEGFCETVRKISKVQEMRQDGPYTWVATGDDWKNHTHLDVLLPGLYINDAPFAKTAHFVFKMKKVRQRFKEYGTSFQIILVSEILTTTQSNFTFPAN